mmetsp:Transcript_10466/g.14018  ORF Transcript_10466/g.14018 Transcript_10466/m.14018 type:complete len:104 (-) Transcript_10466:869-1180(-)
MKFRNYVPIDPSLADFDSTEAQTESAESPNEDNDPYRRFCSFLEDCSKETAQDSFLKDILDFGAFSSTERALLGEMHHITETLKSNENVSGGNSTTTLKDSNV